ncbi:hypothetical protein Ccrd_018251, partial [Cynara cardunculus var. scolymus]
MTDKIFIQTLIGRNTTNLYSNPFTCRIPSWICQIRYDRSPAHDDLVQLGEVVGIIANLLENQ